jgi:ribosomal protein S12 methylthiotransferase accessory factor
METMGITRISNVTDLDIIGVPVAIACRPNSRSLSVTQGKGLTMVAAKVSALMEAAESYHGDHITLPLKLGSYHELHGSLHLMDVYRMQASEAGPFDPYRPLLWIEGTDLISGAPTWVPFDLVHCDFTYASRLGRGMFGITSNGLASGNHLLEAMSHAICEVVERDATALWKVSPEDTRLSSRIDPDSVYDPECREVLGRILAANMMVGIWDTTSEVGLPVFQSVIVPKEEQPWGPVYASIGSGCHPRREVALLRALTEAIQSRLTVIVGSRDDVSRADYERLRSPQVVERAKSMVRGQHGGRDFGEVPTFDRPSFEEDIALELELLRVAGISEVAAVDLTKQELGIPVVRIIIPGFEFAHTMGGDYRPGERARAVMGGRT